MRVDNRNTIYELLKYNMAINDCTNLKKFVELSKVPLEIIYYSNMNDVGKIIKYYAERTDVNE